MSLHHRLPILRYVASGVIIAATLLVQKLLEQHLGAHSPLATLLAGVMLSAWFGGWGPGLFATALAYVTADFLYIEPIYRLFSFDRQELRLVLFAAEGIAICWLMGTLHSTIERRTDSERRLAEADRRKDEFIATLAHELRNPLAPLCHGLQILKSPRATETIKDQARETMERQLQLMVRLVDDLLDLTRIDRGKVELQMERIDLAEAIARAVETVTPLFEAKQHTLKVDLPDQPLWIVGDALRMSQVVSNLLNNAAKYTPDGGRIGVTGRLIGGEVVVTVRDSGLGISRDMLPRIFDLFTQVEASRSRSQGGLGLGLALVRSLVARHGGTVQAQSIGLGCGSEFIVRLPAAVGPMDASARRLAVLVRRRRPVSASSSATRDSTALPANVNDSPPAVEGTRDQSQAAPPLVPQPSARP